MLANTKCLLLNIINLMNQENGLTLAVLEQWIWLPSAMGVKFAFPDEDVVCVTGEGSIQMCIQELSTCMQYGLPVENN